MISWYGLWLWVGERTGVLKQHNHKVVVNILETRQKLEKCFTPQMKKLLEDKVK